MKERLITLALLAAVSIGIAPAFAQVSSDAGIANNDNLLADCMIQQKRTCRRVYKKCTKRAAKKCIKRAKVAPKVTQAATPQTVEKPAVLPQQEETQQTTQQTVEQPAVVSNTPVIIDRFEKRHRSLIHLGLFPFSLFGQ